MLLRYHAFATFAIELNEPGLSRLAGLRWLDGCLVIEALICLEAIVSMCFAVEARHRIGGVEVHRSGDFRAYSSDRPYRKLENGTSPNVREVLRSIAHAGSAK